MADALIPVSICRQYHGGPLLTYELHDDQALRLISSNLLPKSATACKRRWREGRLLAKTYRMPDGRVRLTISERLVIQRDAAFQQLLADLVAVKEVSHV